MYKNKKITVWGYLREYKDSKLQISKIVNKVFSSGNLILGNQVKDFEKNFSNFVGCKYGIGVNSGTDALQIALMCLSLSRNDEVLTTSNTAVPTISAIVSAGLKPVFVDINEDNFLIDTNELKKKITKKTKAIIIVNLYGQTPKFEEILRILKRKKIKIIEDCAQSTGTRYKNKPSGSFGDLSAFSFYPTKNLGAYGDGGMVVTNNKSYYKKCISLRKYGMKKTYYSNFHGINSRLDEIQAAILNFKLKKLKKDIEKRREIAKLYYNKIKNKLIKLPKIVDGCYHSYYVFVVKTSKRKKLMKYLEKNNIFCNISYPYPIHLMKGYKYLGYKKGDLPITEKVANQIFSLPMYPTLKKKEVIKVINIINKYEI